MVLRRRFIALRPCLLVWALLLGACQQEVTPTAAPPAVTPPQEHEPDPEGDAPDVALVEPAGATTEPDDPAPVETPVAAAPLHALDLTLPEPIIGLWRPDTDFEATKAKLLPRLFGTNKKKKTRGVSLSVKPLRDDDVESFMDSVEGAELRVKIQTR